MSELRAELLGQITSLAPHAQHLLLAVSGGADSVALLRLLVGTNYKLNVAHFDHSLRPDSAEDADFVAALCQDLSVEFHAERADVGAIANAKGWNLEDAARRLRYGFLTRTAKRVGAEVVLTAHTQNDQAETVLMQLLRGAAFLKGMSARRGHVVRPLLNVSRKELTDYLTGLDQPYREDETNRDTSRTRAWLRHDVLPLLGSRYSSFKKTLARLSTLQRDQAAHFDTLSKQFIKQDTVKQETVDAARLAGRDVAVQRHVIASLLGRSADFDRIETLRQSLSSSRPVRLSLPKNKTARLAYGRLELLPASTEASLVPHPFSRAEHGEMMTPEVDLARLESFPSLTVRSREPGDTVKLTGGTKKLSDLFIDKKIPREQRNTVPVLASGSEVLWVQDVATDVRVAALVRSADEYFMRLALAQAEKAFAAGELPVGAVIVKDGELIAAAHNETEAQNDPTAHAETLAIRRAAAKLKDWRLEGCTLFVTLEPCPMCFGAMLQAHLLRVVYAASNHREGALGSVAALHTKTWKRHIQVDENFLRKPSESLLRAFFRARR